MGVGDGTSGDGARRLESVVVLGQFGEGGGRGKVGVRDGMLRVEE